ncbi:LPS assembly lipoprotein LptE [Aureimonas altamirensis]|uniref:LPS assembly lipoprotein LptE n=1 Tax=Aureimonas altamirensis TaxID=370622 RepID=UPI001E3A2526|nr:LPS assembly lipoprotein LptE [Aureimonas altamirensis]UHD46162.1 LPS assembly lipoprotein LptE [Aureimonas altamirensis]
MSFSNHTRLRSMCTAGALAGLAFLAACTSGPAYAPPQTSTGPAFEGPALLTDMRGRVSVAAAATRTDQLFRNALVYRLNGADPVSSPLYEVRYVVTALDQVTSVESGTGVPSAASYRMQADYTLIRLSDGETIGAGSRFSTVPYDRNSQLYASQSAVEDARARAARELADRVGMAVLPVLKREAPQS